MDMNNVSPVDLFGRPLRNLQAEGFTSTTMEPTRGSCGLRYTAGVLPAQYRSIAFVDAPGQSGSGQYPVAEGEQNFSGGRVDANTGFWIYTLQADIVELLLDEDGNPISNGPAVGSDLAARIAQNLTVSFFADGQSYDAGYLVDYLSNARGGTAAQGGGFTHQNKLAWPGLRDDKVPFPINPGNSFNISVTSIRRDDLGGEVPEDRLFIVRWWMGGVKWLQGGAAQKR